MRRLLVPLVLVMVFVGLRPTAVVVAQERSTVIVRMEWEPGQLGPNRSRILELQAEPPAGIEPLTTGEDVRYASIELGDVRPFLVAISGTGGGAHVIVDRDMDGDLRDETEYPWKKTGTSLALTPTVLVPMSDERMPVPVPVRIYTNTAANAPVSMYASAHREGEAIIGDRLRRVALVDGNGDLCFDDAKKDHIYVDVDGDGAFAIGHGTPEHIHFGAPWRIGDEGWEPMVPTAAGTVVELRPVAEAPPPIPREWRAGTRGAPGRAQTPPPESFEKLRETFESQMGQAYLARRSNIAALGRTGHPDALPLLVKLAEDEDEESAVRGAAVWAMSNPTYLEKAGPRLVKYARGTNQSLAAAAVQALYDQGHPSREAIFVDLLDSSLASVVSAASRYLAYEHTEAGTAAVLRACREASTGVLRYQAYTGARYLPSGPPAELMLKMAEDDYASLKGRAIEDLALVAHPAARRLALEAADIRPVNTVLARGVVRVLGEAGDAESVAALLRLAADAPETIRTDIVKRLTPLRAPAVVRILVDALKSKQPEQRALAAQVLAGLRDGWITEALVKRALREPDEVALAAMLEALGDHGDPAAVDVLLRATKKRKHPLVRSTAIRALARVGMDVPKVREFFLKLLGSKRWEDRVFAIDAAGAAGDPSLVKKLLPNLGHDRRQVRLAVAEAFSALRPATAVRPMIERLAVEEVQRVRNQIAHALFVTTGMNLYDEHALWERWWKDVGGQFEVPAEIPSLPEAGPGATGAVFYGIPLDSDHVSFVIDQSGSMSASDTTGLGSAAATVNRLDVAVHEVLRALGQLDDRAYANVIFFHSTVFPWEDELKRLTPKNRAKLREHALKQRPTGGTNLYDGLEAALLDDEVDTVMLLSDGVPGAGKYVAADDIVRAIRRLNQTRRIVIHCISLGRESALLRRIAAENGGSYVRK